MARYLFVLRLNAHAGDVLMARPALRAFRRKHPHVRIYFETDRKYHALMAGQTDADFVRHLFESKGQPKEKVIDLCDFRRQPWVSRRAHIMDIMAQALGVEIHDRSYGFLPSAQDDEWAQGEAGRLGPFAAIHTTSAQPSKDWSAVPMGALAKRLKDELRLSVVQVGGPQDVPVAWAAGGTDYRGKLTFGRTAALLARAELFIGPDSLPMHLSRAVRPVPAVCLWGSSSPLTSGLFGPNVVNLEPQRGCGHAGQPCYSRCDWDRHCMEGISGEDVFQAARAMAATGKPEAPEARPDVTVILINWNSWARYTHPTLRALEKTMKSSWDFVLVDNGSKEDAKHLEGWIHPRMSSKILNAENRGCPAAWNQAIRQARGRNILLLNTDIEILKEGWDIEALDAVRKLGDRLGVLGISENEPAALFGDQWQKEPFLPVVPGALSRCHHVNGSAFLIPREALQRVGLFDERYTPGYCEETDYCLRTLLSGLEVWHLGGLIRHEGHAVTAKVNKMLLGPIVKRNSEYFSQKWQGAKAPLLVKPGALENAVPQGNLA